MSVLSAFSAPTRAWFESAFEAPTRVQVEGWSRIQADEHALLLAPTGSGKTLAAFLWSIDRLLRLPEDAEPGVRVLYISPLKALVYDIERNLRTPMIGIQRAAEGLGVPLRPITHSVRTGDTPQKARRDFKKHPPEIFITTPESLFLVLTSEARDALRTVDTVIVDEIHTMAGTKRGAHLALSLERLSQITDVEPRRIGLSATQRPLETIARYLGGDRKVSIVDASEHPYLDLRIVVPVRDMERPWLRPPEAVEPRADPTNELETETINLTYEGKDDRSIWPAIQPKLLELIRAHRTTILFTNSRLLCEKLSQRLNELAGEELVLAHHGSIAHHRRAHIEELLKTGQLKALVATSSLELGIDMGSVDLVIQVESPGSVARGLQRAGRSGHGVGERSVARIFPKYRGDLLECAAVAKHMLEGRIESTTMPTNPLDVLSQHIVAMVGMDEWHTDQLFDVIRRAAPFAQLSGEVYCAVLDMLSGRYPSESFAELRPRLFWDRESDQLTPRKGAKMLAILNAGTIPDRGLYSVHLGVDGPRIGELDEEMVHESRRGHVFILGASTWRIQDITRDRVIVSPAPGVPARMPFWRGQRPGRPVEMGKALGELTRELAAREPEDALAWLAEHCPLDGHAASNLMAYLEDQKAATGVLPSDRCIVVERFRDELGDWRVCILSPFGSRVHAPWALAIEAALSSSSGGTGDAGYEVQTLWTDDGIVIRFADAEELPGDEVFLPDPDDVEETIIEQLDRSALFAGRFRENAARALLLPRKRPGKRTPLWAQRLRAQSLLSEVSRHPSFPIVLETYRECLQDVFDLPGLVDLLRRIRRREVRVVDAETPTASPFARSLIFAYVAAYLYEGDAPLAERKAQALSLDRNLLRELLGQEELRDLLDPLALAEIEEELQCLTEDRKANDLDDVHLMVRRLGGLTDDELRARCRVELDLSGLRGRIVSVRIAGESRWIAVEDVARYRDALGVSPPVGLAQAYLESVDSPLEDLVRRFARTHGPFSPQELASRLGLLPAQVLPVLRALLASERIVHGEIRPGGRTREWCDADVLKRIRRRTLARLRKQIAAVDGTTLARFLPTWMGIGSSARGQARMEEVVDQLEGLPLPFSELERRVLPARVRGFESRMLDELGATGGVVWVGRGALGPGDGKIALLRREHVPLLLDEPIIPDDLSTSATQVLEHLDTRGASFLTEIQAACGNAKTDALVEALWDLAWSGLVTNDTFAPLRALGRPKRVKRSRRRISGGSLSAGGRWSLVSSLFHEAPSPTARAHARSIMLLERYGVVSREAAIGEELPGGFAGLYPVLRAMEESGKVRRGWFVEGLSGGQFAMPGAVDGLRAARKEQPMVLSALDPANPWGTLLPWPDSSGTPRRASGCVVVLHGGDPLVWLPRSAKSILSFPAAQDSARLVEGLLALKAQMSRFFDKTLTVEHVDGAPAVQSDLLESFKQGGFTVEEGRLRLVDF